MHILSKEWWFNCSSLYTPPPLPSFPSACSSVIRFKQSLSMLLSLSQLALLICTIPNKKPFLNISQYQADNLLVWCISCILTYRKEELNIFSRLLIWGRCIKATTSTKHDTRKWSQEVRFVETVGDIREGVTGLWSNHTGLSNKTWYDKQMTFSPRRP